MNPAGTLRAARLGAGMTQVDLARRGGTSQASVSAYESGAKTPSLATFERLLAATGTRLQANGGHVALALPSTTEQRRIARDLSDVLALAAALPTSHTRELSYPRLRS